MKQETQPTQKHFPNLIVALHADDTERFIAAVTKALCNGWTRFTDVPPEPNKPAIYRFIRERPGAKRGAICLQRLDSEKMHTVCIDAPADPMSPAELTAFIEEFAEDILDRVHPAGIKFTAYVYKQIVFPELLDAKALELLYYFATNTNKETPLDEWEDRDRFQHFLLRLHRTKHRLTPETMFFWATQEQGMSVDAAGAIGIAFEFTMQTLQLYDRYLEARKTNPDLP